MYCKQIECWQLTDCVAHSQVRSHSVSTRPSALISVQELALLLAENKDVVVLAVANEEDYKSGHIPQAVRIWRPDYQLEITEQQPFDGMLLGKEEFEDFAQKCGVNNSSIVVAYDHKYDATRVWWAFQVFGKSIRVLNGGFLAWSKLLPRCTNCNCKDRVPSRGDFEAAPKDLSLFASTKEVAATQTLADTRLWDVRTIPESTGEVLLRPAFRPGRIPWGVRIDWNSFVRADGCWLTPTEARPRAETLGLRPDLSHVFYCQSGVRTTQLIFALHELVGHPLSQLKNYDGSWIEWSFFDHTPKVTGPL